MLECVDQSPAGAAPVMRRVHGQEMNPDKSKPLAPGVPDIFAFKDLAIKPVPLPVDSFQPERRPWVLETYLTSAKDNLAAAEKRVGELGKKSETATKKLEELTKTPPPAEKTRKAAEAAVADTSAELHAATLAVEWAPRVRVNALDVGLVRTPAAHYAEESARDVPLGRFAEPDEVGYAAVFLASPLAAYVSGARLLVHGGGEVPVPVYGS